MSSNHKENSGKVVGVTLLFLMVVFLFSCVGMEPKPLDSQPHEEVKIVAETTPTKPIVLELIDSSEIEALKELSIPVDLESDIVETEQPVTEASEIESPLPDIYVSSEGDIVETEQPVTEASEIESPSPDIYASSESDIVETEQSVIVADEIESQPPDIYLVQESAFLVPDGERIALVIGNSSYQHLNQLSNPENDATDMAELLGRLGFEVDLLLDSSLIEIEAGIRTYLDKSKDSEVKTTLFFYAGHAVQYEGINYLIPIDSDIKREYELIGKAYNMEALLKGLDRSSTELNLIILDACRDNPFSTSRGGARGLSAMGFGSSESMVVFATSPGSVAADGVSRNSPFTQAMKEHLPTPDLEVRQLIAQVSKSVQEETGGRQIPWVNTSFTGQFYFLTGLQEVHLRQLQLGILSSELAALEAELLAMENEIASAQSADKRSQLEIEQKRIEAQTTAKRLEEERIYLLQAEAEKRIAAQQKEQRARQLLQSQLSEEGRLLEELAQQRRLELEKLAQQHVSSAGAMFRLRTIAQYEQTIIDVGESYDETIRLSNIEFANLKNEQIASYKENDPQDPWETLEEFQDRVNLFEAQLVAEANQQIAEIERQRYQDIESLHNEMEAYKDEASQTLYTIGFELADTQVGSFDAPQKFFPIVATSKDTNFPFIVSLEYLIAATEREAIGEEYNRIDTAANANALMSKLHYSISELYPQIWVVELERYELFNLLEEEELSPILHLNKADLEFREFIFKMEKGQLVPYFAVTQFISNMGNAVVYKDGVEIAKSGDLFIIKDEEDGSLTTYFYYPNGITFETEVNLTRGINAPIEPQNLIRPESFVPVRHHGAYYSDLESFNSSVNNEDKKVNAGESIRLNTAVYNSGSATVTNLKAVFSTESPYVTIDKDYDSIEYGDLEGGKYKSLDLTYSKAEDVRYYIDRSEMVRLNISRYAPAGTVVPVKIVFTDGIGRRWEDAFSFTITAPDVKPSYAGSCLSDYEEFNKSINNEDMKVNAGESIRFDAAVYNSGNTTLKGLKAVFSTESPYVTIDKDYNSIEYGDLEGRKYRSLSGTYSNSSDIEYYPKSSNSVKMSINRNAPAGTVVPVKVVYSDIIGRRWEDEFNFTITVPDIKIDHVDLYFSDLGKFKSSVNNEDNKVNAGESIYLDMAIHNRGSSRVKGLKAVFSTENLYVTINETYNTISYGDLDGGKYKTLSGTYSSQSDIRYSTDSIRMIRMTISPDTPAGTVVPVKVVYTDAIGHTWEDTLSFTITNPDVKISHAGSFYSDSKVYISSTSNEDLKVFAGETINLDIAVHNSGSSKVKGLKATFSVKSSYVTIESGYNSISYGDLDGGKYKTISGTYSSQSNIRYSTDSYRMIRMTISKNTPAGTVVPVKVVYSDVLNRTFEDVFTIIVERRE